MRGQQMHHNCTRHSRESITYVPANGYGVSDCWFNQVQLLSGTGFAVSSGVPITLLWSKANVTEDDSNE